MKKKETNKNHKDIFQIITDEQLLVVFNDTKYVCDRSQRLAKDIVNKLNVRNSNYKEQKKKTEKYLDILIQIPPMIINETNIELITKLVALVVQMKVCRKQLSFS